MIRIIVMPTAMIPWFETCRNTLTMFETVRNFDVANEIDDEQHKDEANEYLRRNL